MNKRKIFFYLFFVIMIFQGIVFGKELRYEDSDIKGKLVYDKNENRPFTGILKRYYKSGEIYRETSYKEGKKDGLEKEYYTNGVVLADMMYKDGKSNGPAHEYFCDGSLVSEDKYALVPISDVSTLLVEHKVHLENIDLNYHNNPIEYIYDYLDSKTAIRNRYSDDGINFEKKVYKKGCIDYITYDNDWKITGIKNVYNYEWGPQPFGWYLGMSKDGTVIENGIKSNNTYIGGYFDNEYLNFYIDGAYRIYYNNGEPKFFANAFSNIPVGIQRKYYDDGTLRSVYGYTIGYGGDRSYYGICQEYYETGQIKSEEIYEKNRYVSIYGQDEYKPSCISEKKYDQNGILRIENTNELYKTYDETGALLSEKKYVNVGYNDNWQLVYIKEYNKNTDTFSIEYIDPIPSERKRKANYDKNGMIYGNAIIYEKNNKKVIEAQFKDGMLNGEYKAYYSNGKIRAKVNFKDGKADGRAEYYKNGKLFSKSSYKKGIKEGKEYIYYPDGKLFAEMEWQDNRDKNTGDRLYMNTYYYGKNTDNDIYEDEEWGLFPLYEFIYVPLYKGFEDEYNNGSQAVGSDQDHDCGPGPLTRDEIYQEHRLTGTMTVFDKKGKLLYKKTFKNGDLIE